MCLFGFEFYRYIFHLKCRFSSLYRATVELGSLSHIVCRIFLTKNPPNSIWHVPLFGHDICQGLNGWQTWFPYFAINISPRGKVRIFNVNGGGGWYKELPTNDKNLTICGKKDKNWKENRVFILQNRSLSVVAWAMIVGDDKNSSVHIFAVI